MLYSPRCLSVVIPALNEEAGIADIATRVLALRGLLAGVGVDGLELIVVDDGSTDRTAAVAAAIHGVRVISHARNLGYGAAIKSGFRAASGDLLAFLDADGTYPPEGFGPMCRALLEGDADVVVGSRMTAASSQMPAVRRMGNLFFARLVNIIGATQVSDSASGQRIVRRQALERLYPLPDGLNFTPVMTTRAIHEGLKMIEVPIRYTERVGRSKLSVLHDGRRFLTTILWTALGYNPARMLGMIGLWALALAGLLGAGLVVLRSLGVQSLGPWGVASAFGVLVLSVAGISIINTGIAFNYLVGLFSHRPVQQGLFGRPLLPGLDRQFGWLGLLAMAVGLVVAIASVHLGFSSWGITRLWLWLLGSALAILMGLELVISWLLMRILEDLSVRELRTSEDLGTPFHE